MIEFFSKYLTIKNRKIKTVFTKISIIDVWQGPKYISDAC